MPADPSQLSKLNVTNVTNVDTWKEFDQNVITHSAAHHLMAIDELIREFGYARVSDIARQLNITRGSVSISLQPLKRAGLVVQDVNRHLQLSEEGQALVDAIRTKRHLLQRFLTEVLGVQSEQARIDACKMEHLTSNATAKQLVLLLRYLDTENKGKSLLKELRDFQMQCDHDPTHCETCPETCLVDQVDVDTPAQE